MGEGERLSVVMPIYNEVQTFELMVQRVLAAPPSHLEKELIIVDDGSFDGTRERLKAIEQAYPNIKVFRHERNRGKGAALRTGFAQATGDILIVQDADLEYDPQEYPRLLQPILQDKADVVYGSRFTGGPRRVLLFWHTVGNKLLTLLSNAMNDLNLTDMETGYKVFRKEVLKNLPLRSNRFGFEPEFTAKIARRRFRIYEIPISYWGRSWTAGKKAGWKDGIAALFAIIWYRFFD